MLVGYLETEDFDRARKLMSETSINAVWQASMKDFFVDEAGRTADKQMRPLEQVFFLP
jgi:L-rhamnose mutarotase